MNLSPEGNSRRDDSSAVKQKPQRHRGRKRVLEFSSYLANSDLRFLQLTKRETCVTDHTPEVASMKAGGDNQ